MKLFIFLAFIVATMAKLHQSERLLDQAIDQLELELAAKGEKDIYFQNDLDEVMFVNWDCDRKSLMSQESSWSAGLNVAFEGVEVGGSLSNTEKKEWTYQYISRNTAFIKIQPGAFLEESTGLNCQQAFVDIWTIKSNGEVNKFMSKSGVNDGEMIRVYGTADRPLYDKTFEVCGGQKCGCKQNKCWKTCMGISKCDTKLGNIAQMKDHFYRYSASYKKYMDEERKTTNLSQLETMMLSINDSLARGAASVQLLHSDGKVKCTQDRECKPSFNCKGACLLWG